MSNATHITGFDAFTSVGMFGILAGIDVYRYSTGAISGKQLAVNLGEHALGTGGSLGGSALGATAGAALLGPPGAVIGFLLGGILGNFLARSAYRKGASYFAKKFEYENFDQLALDSAKMFDIDLRTDTYK